MIRPMDVENREHAKKRPTVPGGQLEFIHTGSLVSAHTHITHVPRRIKALMFSIRKKGPSSVDPACL